MASLRSPVTLSFQCSDVATLNVAMLPPLGESLCFQGHDLERPLRYFIYVFHSSRLFLYFTWGILAILRFHPITLSHQGFSYRNHVFAVLRQCDFNCVSQWNRKPSQRYRKLFAILKPLYRQHTAQAQVVRYRSA